MTSSTPSLGHVPALPGVSRRSLLRASPALLAPALLAGPALAAAPVVPDTPILALFREWRAFFRHLNSPVGPDLDGATGQPHFDRLIDMEAAILAEPATCLHDLAAKIVAESNYGDFMEGFEEIVAECIALMEGVA